MTSVLIEAVVTMVQLSGWLTDMDLVRREVSPAPPVGG